MGSWANNNLTYLIKCLKYNFLTFSLLFKSYVHLFEYIHGYCSILLKPKTEIIFWDLKFTVLVFLKNHILLRSRISSSYFWYFFFCWQKDGSYSQQQTWTIQMFQCHSNRKTKRFWASEMIFYLVCDFFSALIVIH